MENSNALLNLLVIVVLSYLAGSIPTSIIVSKLIKGIDIRDYGSGNAGGTNSFRVLGWKAGLAVVIFDIFKGFISAAWISNFNGFQPHADIWAVAPVLGGAAAVFGHCFTVFAGFKGGKGIATAAGMIIALEPMVFLVCLLVFAVVLVFSGYVSLSSLSTAAAFPVSVLIFNVVSPGSVSFPFLVFSFLVAAFVFYTHRANIKRLLSGKENRFDTVRIFAKK